MVGGGAHVPNQWPLVNAAQPGTILAPSHHNNEYFWRILDEVFIIIYFISSPTSFSVLITIIYIIVKNIVLLYCYSIMVIITPVLIMI